MALEQERSLLQQRTDQLSLTLELRQKEQREQCEVQKEQQGQLQQTAREGDKWRKMYQVRRKRERQRERERKRKRERKRGCIEETEKIP